MRSQLCTVVVDLPIEQFLRETDQPDLTFTCEVTYRYYPGYPATGERGYSLGTPEEFPSVSIVRIGYKDRDVTDLITDAVWEKLALNLLTGHL